MLIIGILAAVALPQYKLAVTKSRVATILPTLKAIAQANAVYYLANGVYSPNVHNLDVSIPGECTDTGNGVGGQVWKCGNDFLVDNSEGHFLRAFYCPKENYEYYNCGKNSDFRITMYIENSKSPIVGCIATEGSSLGQKVCNSLSF